MSAHSSQPTEPDDPAKRRTLKRIGIGAGTVATLGAGSSAVPRLSPVGRAEAVPWNAIKAGAAGASGAVGLGWALREYEIIGSDDPPEGLTPDVLKSTINDAARKRQSNNRSTYVDNENIIGGIEHAAYGDGKVDAIEALNAQKTQEEVRNAATSAVDSYETTVKKNLLDSWNESIKELWSFVDTVESHSDTLLGDVFQNANNTVENIVTSGEQTITSGTVENTITASREITLPDGSSYTLNRAAVHDGVADHVSNWDPIQNDTASYGEATLTILGDSNVTYLRFSDLWNSIWSKVDTAFTNVRNGLTTWVDNVYGEVQAGELDTSDLLTPRELAASSADEEGVNQAIADLIALNIPVDLEREATVTFDNQNSDTVTISGMLAPTDPPENGINSGETYDPANLSGDFYFNYDISKGSALWSAYETAVDGGTVTFTREPYVDTDYRINTTAGEQVVLNADDFTHDNGGTPDDPSDDVWTTDITSKVETAITEVDAVEMAAQTGETQYELIRLQQPFTVESIQNTETGEESDSMSFSSSEPQDDSNYITQEEWQQMQERNQELIDKYEEAKNDNSGPGPIFGGGNPLEGNSGLIGLGIIGVVVLAVVGFVTDLIPGLGGN